MQTRLLITGASGQLGSRLYTLFSQDARYKVFAPGHSELDVSLQESVQSYLKEVKPEQVIHAAAYTQVDRAEDEPELCFAVNSLSTHFISEYCKMHKAKLFLISSDYVFGGEGIAPFKELPSNDKPLNVYGDSKKKAEEYFLASGVFGAIIRTSWVFSYGYKNFIDTMITLSKSHDELRVVNDQTGSPSFADDLALCIYKLLDISFDDQKIIHMTNEGFCTWYELCAYAFSELSIDTKLIPVSSSELKTKALRPKNSRLEKLFLQKHQLALPNWQDAVKRYVSQVRGAC